MSEVSVKVDDRSRLALECFGLFDRVPYETSDPEWEIQLAWRETGLLVADSARATLLADAINAVSNELDELSREASDKDQRRWYRQDSRALSALFVRILRARERAGHGVSR